MSVRLCVSVEQLGPHCTDLREILYMSIFRKEDRGDTVVKVLCYKSEGHWIDPSWFHWIFH